MIHVVATITTTPGKRAEFLAEFQQLVPQVRAEDGCIEYVPAVDVDSGLTLQPAVRENCVVVFEKWASLEALRVHLTAPHLEAFRERTQTLVADLTLLVLEPQT